MTWLPAPIAYSISVAVGDSETIALGRALMCTTPVWVVTATGKVPVAGRAAARRAGWMSRSCRSAAADTASTAAAAKASGTSRETA